MADYDFSGLEPRSFEHLIQAIALKVIGPNITILGDGKDGGRDITFNGPIPYPTDSNKWNGYGIIQVKFRQRANDSTTDSTWVIKELRKELKKFTDPQRGLRKPEYYIFATNVIFSSVSESGTNDKVHEVIKEFQNSLPLKECNFWHYDTLCRFIDCFDDIRKAYTAFITSSDVLANLIEKLKNNPRDEIKFEIDKNSIYEFTPKTVITLATVSLSSVLGFLYFLNPRIKMSEI